jgi:hypothetical protein
VVALVLFQISMLALAAGAVVAARDLAGARRMELARALGRNRVERLALSTCPAPVVGASETNGITEHWRVDAVGGRRFIKDSVLVRRPNGTFAVVVQHATVLCRP